MNRARAATVDPGFTARRIQAGLGTVVPQTAKIDRGSPLNRSPALAEAPSDAVRRHLRARPRTATGTTATEAAFKSP